MKTPIFVDMDGVLADFHKSPLFEKGDELVLNPPRMYEKRFFETLPVIDGALWGVRELMNLEDAEVHILSSPVLYTHYSYSEKASWIAKYFPELTDRLNLSQNKEFYSKVGRILIDDYGKKWRQKWESGGGIFYHFDHDIPHREMWEKTVKDIKTIIERKQV